MLVPCDPPPANQVAEKNGLLYNEENPGPLWAFGSLNTA